MMMLSIRGQEIHGYKPGRASAFTMVEMMVTSGVFALVAVGFIYAHLFGLKQDELIQSKLGASDQSRRSFGLLETDIRSCKIWQIGTNNGSTFTAIAAGTPQIGNSLQLLLTTGSTTNITYYFDTSVCQLRRTKTGVAGYTVIAQDLTNTMFFSAETYRGVTQTAISHKAVINVVLQYAQFQYPRTKVGSNDLYDYYKMQFKLASHVPDGQ